MQSSHRLIPHRHAGYTLNKAALKLLVTQGLPQYFPNTRKSNEDLLIGRLFRQFNVSPYWTMDEHGSQRYNHWPPGRHFMGAEAPFYKKYTNKLNYNQRAESFIGLQRELSLRE